LEFVLICKLLRPGQINRLANDLVGVSHFLAEGVIEPLLDESDGEMRDVDANPAAIQALGDGDGGSASAEGIEDGVALIGTALMTLSRRASGFCVGYPRRSCACELIGKMSSQTFCTGAPGISSRYRLYCGTEPGLVWMMRPDEISSSIFSLL